MCASNIRKNLIASELCMYYNTCTFSYLIQHNCSLVYAIYPYQELKVKLISSNTKTGIFKQYNVEINKLFNISIIENVLFYRFQTNKDMT